MFSKFINSLTAKQNEVLGFIAQFFKSNGFAPSIREIGGNFKIAPSSALDHLKALEKKGYIRRVPSKPRCLEILKKDFYDNE